VAYPRARDADRCRSGDALANIVFFFIILTTGRLFFQKRRENRSAEQAALALKPFAENMAYLFSLLDIIAPGWPVAVLAGSGVLRLCEVMKWRRRGWNSNFRGPKEFYLIIRLFDIIVGLLINFIGIERIKALYFRLSQRDQLRFRSSLL